MAFFLLYGSHGYGAEKCTIQEFKPGKVENDYFLKLSEPLGRGAMATVYEGTQKTVEKKRVAIRRIALATKPASFIKDELQGFFFQKKLTHPNLLPVHDIYKTHLHLDAILPLMEGGELFDLVVEHKALPHAVAEQYLAYILDAIAYIHEQGLIFRDLKPENLMFQYKLPPGQKYPKGSDIRLGDFGFTRKSSDKKGLACRCGTFSYMAPESFCYEREMERDCSYEVDIWAIGCTFYTMVHGHLMFEIRKYESMYLLFQRIQTRNYTLTCCQRQHTTPEYTQFFTDIFNAPGDKTPRMRPSCREIQRKYPWAQIPGPASAPPHESSDLRHRLSTLQLSSTPPNSSIK